MGEQLNRICKQVADACPDSASKRDLLADIKSVTLYCHQLQIRSKVKADHRLLYGELRVSLIRDQGQTFLPSIHCLQVEKVVNRS